MERTACHQEIAALWNSRSRGSTAAKRGVGSALPDSVTEIIYWNACWRACSLDIQNTVFPVVVLQGDVHLVLEHISAVKGSR